MVVQEETSQPARNRLDHLLTGVSFFLSWALNATFSHKRLAANQSSGVPHYVRVASFSKRETRSWLLTIGLVTASGTLASGGDDSVIRTIVTSEEQILALTPGLASLSKGLMNLQLPDAPRQKLFAPTFDLINLEGGGESGWQPSPDRKSMTADTGQIWSSLLDEVAYFEHAKFAIVKGGIKDGDRKRFTASIDFSALARIKVDRWRQLSAKLTVAWEDLSTTDGETDWRITDWHTKEFSSVDSDQLWFQESLEEALPRSRDLNSLRRSQHHEETITFYAEGRKGIPHRYFAPISVNQKPGIAIADIDGDGDDDVYVTVRRGYNKLLENQGDGTFRETASFHGLDVKNHSTCAIFADFDNDGDPDLMLGRSLLPCKYFENNAGWFSEIKSVTLPRLVISMSATDYNNDGLLDVYLCTYRPAVLGGSSPAGGVASESKNWPDEFLSPGVAKEYYQRHAESHSKDQGNMFPNLLDQIGPPNVLLVNKGGGKFEPAPESAQIGVWRNSLQATWSDYDDDGDPDLYIANDWAADHLFRNDGEAGFSDVTAEAGTTAFGFAMGATWGDYDNDGEQDLYVTNMFSKAGQRITSQVEGLNADYAESATGNYLYRQKDGGKFDLVSGLKPPAMLVAKAGWGWGGQFADFNNDGWLDIHSINGYFTAPKEVATEVDL